MHCLRQQPRVDFAQRIIFDFPPGCERERGKHELYVVRVQIHLHGVKPLQRRVVLPVKHRLT